MDLRKRLENYVEYLEEGLAVTEGYLKAFDFSKEIVDKVQMETGATRAVIKELKEILEEDLTSCEKWSSRLLSENGNWDLKKIPIFFIWKFDKFSTDRSQLSLRSVKSCQTTPQKFSTKNDRNVKKCKTPKTLSSFLLMTKFDIFVEKLF